MLFSCHSKLLFNQKIFKCQFSVVARSLFIISVGMYWIKTTLAPQFSLHNNLLLSFFRGKTMVLYLHDTAGVDIKLSECWCVYSQTENEFRAWQMLPSWLCCMCFILFIRIDKSSQHFLQETSSAERVLTHLSSTKEATLGTLELNRNLDSWTI